MTDLTPFLKLALLQDGVAPKSAPGPARPTAQTNGIKAITIPNSAVQAEQDPNMVPPEQMAKAEQATEQAKSQAVLAQHQAKLQQQQLQHSKAMSSAGSHMGNGYFGSKIKTTMGTIGKLNQQASIARLNHGLYDLNKAAADEPPAVPLPTHTRSGAAWPKGRPAPMGMSPLPHPADTMQDQGIDYTTWQQGGYGTPETPQSGVLETFWNGLKDPDKMLTVGRAAMNGSGIMGDKAVAPFDTNPTAGSLGSYANPTLNWLSNIPRHLGNMGAAAGMSAVGAVSHLGQATAAMPRAIGDIWAARKTPAGIWGTPLKQMSGVQKMLDQTGKGIWDTANTALTVAPWGRAGSWLARAGGMIAPGLAAPMANYENNRAVAAAKAQQQAIREAAIAEGQPQGGIGDFLKNLLGQLGPYLQGISGQVTGNGAPDTTPSEDGGGGLRVRNPNRI